MNRADLQQLAGERLLDAAVLLEGGRWSGAYYLAGYAVECGLKSCVLAYVERTGAIFQDRRFAEKCFTHDFDELVKLARLEEQRGLDIQAEPILARNWLMVKDWTVESRYDRSINEAEARILFNAVNDIPSGVLQWIERYW